MTAEELLAAAEQARRALEAGAVGTLGSLMDDNYTLLVEMGVSSPRLDELVKAARRAGALGAKLSGAGRGGNVIALVEEESTDEVAQALREAGAVRVIQTLVYRTSG